MRSKNYSHSGRTLKNPDEIVYTKSFFKSTTNYALLFFMPSHQVWKSFGHNWFCSFGRHFFAFEIKPFFWIHRFSYSAP